MDEINDNIKKMYLRINGEVIEHEMQPKPQKKGKTFTLDEDQVKKLEEWKEHIKIIYGKYGDYEYRFTSNGIGQIVNVYSELANTTLNLTDVDKW